ncbi:MAG: FHA domain-containing protein [Bdellovibrionales bacterium]|nr:FHA domain-containing protein [Bdellovibrionales bacterium]
MEAAQRLSTYPIYVLITHGKTVIFEKTIDSLPITIGRSSHCNIALTQFNWISRQHAVIFPENGQLYLVDLKSSNGIQIGGRTYDRIEIHNGTIANIGPLIFQFGLPQESLTKTFSVNQNVESLTSPPTLPNALQGQGDEGSHSKISLGPIGPPPVNARKGRFYPELDSESISNADGELKYNRPDNKSSASATPSTKTPRAKNEFDPDATIVERPSKTEEKKGRLRGENVQSLEPSEIPQRNIKPAPIPLPSYLREEIRPSRASQNTVSSSNLRDSKKSTPNRAAHSTESGAGGVLKLTPLTEINQSGESIKLTVIVEYSKPTSLGMARSSIHSSSGLVSRLSWVALLMGFICQPLKANFLLPILMVPSRNVQFLTI